MVERLCPKCGAANPAQQRHCGDCGAQIEQPLQRRSLGALSARTIRLPAQWQQTGRVVALGILTVAAEAGLHWLQRQQHATPTSSVSQQRVVALQQRIIERWQNGQLQERMLERTIWLDPDQTKR